MTNRRACAWMSGPRDASLRVPAAKWWLAVSRDVLAKNYRRQMAIHRPPVSCDLTPTFTSPLTNKSH